MRCYVQGMQLTNLCDVTLGDMKYQVHCSRVMLTESQSDIKLFYELDWAVEFERYRSRSGSFIPVVTAVSHWIGGTMNLKASLDQMKEGNAS
jgi:hypothetical protein